MAKKKLQGTPTEKDGAAASPGHAKAGVDRGRDLLSQLLWALAVVAALFLAIGALLIAIKANADNGLVEFVKGGADFFDVGVFSRNDGIRQFMGDNAEIKNALFNWGLAAILWLIVGRVVSTVVKP